MKIQLEMQKLSQAPVTSQQLENPKLELNRIIPRFNSKEDEMGLYLTIFERQAKFLNIPEKTWTAYLIGSFSPDIAQLIAREDEDDAQNYEKKKEEFRKPFPLKKNQPVGGSHEYHSSGPSRTVPKFPGYKTEGRNPIGCYGCGTPGVIKSKCPKCTRANEMETAVNCMTLFNLNSNLYPTSVIVLKIFGEKIAVCADTGASHTIAGEKMFKFLQEHDVTFTNKRISFMMADGIRQTIMAVSTAVDLYIEGKVIATEFLVLPDAKGNKTLIRLDFLNAAGIVLDVQGRKWHFSGNPRKQYKFFKKTLEDITLSAFELREDEGKNLYLQNRQEKSIYSWTEMRHVSNQGESSRLILNTVLIRVITPPPIATSSYRMNPVKKEVLREQIEELLRQNVIEEFESPYAAPVVLVPKPNGKVRLCVDYRKLNSVTKVDAYPLPRMDDLLNEATPTSFMSTIDLQSGYHQVKVADVDQDKTAFVCPFGTYRYLRMPFGLRNAPATFQRLIDKFRSGLKDVFALSYLDDTIVLSETFGKHLEDLEKVFERLSIFKLHANRDKCHFACDRVKYLGFWITKDEIEADQEKISAIQKIPVPTNVKEVQSLL
ncbi:retrovirus-related Pol polyprotein from transposon 17.6 [Trichonephila clavipes]|nr:retrovirus-related Pol polyprotein from transposon 17.6 [Trichonephila clavipes]